VSATNEITVRTVVVGSGCAGLNAADTLAALGEESLLLVTEDMNAGTSRNTGSDKQTYYKLSLAGDENDSVGALAHDLHYPDVNGDTALCEAAASAPCFLKLASLGVPFPANEYGEYVGYQTDHDTRRRATSAGPLTSKYMTEAL
jgi:succinate dehydrogenase/fumarate reductase flavoprotein subunit